MPSDVTRRRRAKMTQAEIEQDYLDNNADQVRIYPSAHSKFKTRRCAVCPGRVRADILVCPKCGLVYKLSFFWKKRIHR